jgi:predicted ATPase
LDEALQIVKRTGSAEWWRSRTSIKVSCCSGKGISRLRILSQCPLSIAEEQEAKLRELRAATCLARLRRDQGRRAEGRDLLAPVYGWVTEGFDTLDLKEAKALLDELSA